MSNWDYAQETATEKWRKAMTLPQKIEIAGVNGNCLNLFNYPLKKC